jgi:hypothetical protein
MRFPAHGHDADGNLTQVNVWKNGSAFAFAGGGNGTDGDFRQHHVRHRAGDGYVHRQRGRLQRRHFGHDHADGYGRGAACGLGFHFHESDDRHRSRGRHHLVDQ